MAARFGAPEFLVTDVPLQAIVERAAAGIYKAKTSASVWLRRNPASPSSVGVESGKWKLVVRL